MPDHSCCSIRCITTYLIGWRHVQHIILFKDGSEIVVDRQSLSGYYYSWTEMWWWITTMWLNVAIGDE